LMEENRELFAVWETIDQGKTLERARIEVDRAVSNFSYYLPSSLPHSFEESTNFRLDTFQHTSCMRSLR
jgi:acyl-CoA reductase-like NAD-dependent aldehyde dehydrogenase